ncbi:TAXI family TRAP transporter solute-binding subunit [Streptomyces sp. NBC_01619]|uniref:TAXI family TRAP transporter solute-binding subunit n=1 Tax=Streptomyces pratisoli TaxID=3139917 RepID=A0ACC6QPH7_9ACTN|nr:MULTISPECIES: TAXI family TRAP transporter solute-binding subunit [unclassified Streptomyces]MCX4515259.1 TAXI family TRAP transporter solute-binding subunit [Streptomyces sp. NBC_01619]
MLSALSRISRRRALQGATALAVVCGLLLWWLLPLGESAPSGRLTFSTGVNSGVYQRYGELLKGALARDLPKVSIDLRTSEGSQQNLARVASGEADFTVATADAVAKYQRDARPGADRLRGCARLYDDYVQLVVPRGSPVRTPADLRGKRVGVGQQGSGVRLIADRVLTAAGLDSVRDIDPVSAGIDTMPGLLERDELDAFFWSGGLPTGAVQNLSDRFPVRLVPVDDELIRRVHATGEATRYYHSAVIPSDAYPKTSARAPVQTVAVANLLVTTDRADPELTEQFTRTVINSRDRIGREVHPAQLVDLRTAIYTDPLPLHEGARRYYASVKP